VSKKNIIKLSKRVSVRINLFIIFSFLSAILFYTGRVFESGEVVVIAMFLIILSFIFSLLWLDSLKQILSALASHSSVDRKKQNKLENKKSIQSSTADEILKLSKLKDDGILSYEEFELKKNQLLDL
jgi:hypothetical protein